MPPIHLDKRGREGFEDLGVRTQMGVLFAGLSPAGQRPWFAARGCEGLGPAFLCRKEVIQPHLPVRLPCYDFTPLTRHTFGTVLHFWLD